MRCFQGWRSSARPQQSGGAAIYPSLRAGTVRHLSSCSSASVGTQRLACQRKMLATFAAGRYSSINIDSGTAQCPRPLPSLRRECITNAARACVRHAAAPFRTPRLHPRALPAALSQRYYHCSVVPFSLAALDGDRKDSRAYDLAWMLNRTLRYNRRSHQGLYVWLQAYLYCAVLDSLAQSYPTEMLCGSWSPSFSRRCKYSVNPLAKVILSIAARLSLTCTAADFTSEQCHVSPACVLLVRGTMARCACAHVSSPPVCTAEAQLLQLARK